MSKNKYSRFGINYLSPSRDLVYSYTALDETKESVLMIRPRGEFDIVIPASISATCGNNFMLSDHEEITAEQFWKAFKTYTLELYRFYQDQLEESEINSVTTKQR